MLASRLAHDLRKTAKSRDHQPPSPFFLRPKTLIHNRDFSNSASRTLPGLQNPLKLGLAVEINSTSLSAYPSLLTIQYVGIGIN
jgi:hypothetical protein